MLVIEAKLTLYPKQMNQFIITKVGNIRGRVWKYNNKNDFNTKGEHVIAFSNAANKFHKNIDNITQDPAEILNAKTIKPIPIMSNASYISGINNCEW